MFKKSFLFILYCFNILPTADFDSVSIIASITCSTLIYESLNSLEMLSAFISTSFIFLVADTPCESAPSPYTFGSLSISKFTVFLKESIDIFIFSIIFGINPSS